MRILCRELDRAQRRIAWRSDRNLLVIAGPGAGKTRLLTNVAAYRLRLDPAANWRVLCLTFTVEAAKQMRNRLHARELAIRRRDRIHATNFHGFAAELLTHYGDRIGWPRDAQVLSAPEAKAVLMEAAAELNLRVSERDIANDVSKVKGGRQLRDPSQAPTLQRLLRRYEEKLRSLAARDYDDLILHALQLLDDAEVRSVLHRTYRHILVDELQDTSKLQLDLVAKLSDEGRTPVFGVADDDQMIYAFRDARIENLEEWLGRFRAQRMVLSGNYRCPPRIVELANSIIAPNRRDNEKPLHSKVKDREGEVFLIRATGQAQHAEATARVARREVALGRRPEQIAVIGFANARLAALEPDFKANGLDVALLDTTASEASPIVQVFRAALAARTRTDGGLLRRLERLLAKHAAVPALDAARVAASLAAIEDSLSLLRSVLLLPMASSERETEQVRGIVAAGMTEFGSIAPDDFARRLQIEWSRLHGKVLREERSIKLLTAHKAKGLEFEVVVIPHMNQGAVPTGRADRPVPESEMADRRRSFYVSLTRTSHRIYLVTDASLPPSQFLSEMPRECVEELRLIA